MKTALGFLFLGAGLLHAAALFAQEQPAPPGQATGSFPAQPPPADTTQPAPAPAPAPPAQQPVAQQPAQPQPAPPPPANGAQPAQQPPPAYPAQQSPPPAQQSYPPPPTYPEQGYGPPPPPPEKPKEEGFKMPPWSVRIDPFNWLLEGRLGLELEVGLLKFMSFELVPIFVVNDQPPTLNFSGIEDTLYQESNGLGAMAGSSFSLGFWLEGKALEGYVLRAILTNYGYKYRAEDGAGLIDQVTHTERHFYGFIGSHSRWGAFTLAGGIGLGVELNKESRCFPESATSPADATSSGCDEQQIAVKRSPLVVTDLNSPFHPVQIMGRFSLGITID